MQSHPRPSQEIAEAIMRRAETDRLVASMQGNFLAMFRESIVEDYVTRYLPPDQRRSVGAELDMTETQELPAVQS